MEKKDNRRRILEVLSKIDKSFKLNEEIQSGLESTQQYTMPTDDEIVNELRKNYEGTLWGKAGPEFVDNRIKHLFDMHAKWIGTAKQHYNAQEIARVLFKYDSRLNK